MTALKFLTGLEVSELYPKFKAQLTTKKSLTLDLTDVEKVDFTSVAMLVSLTKVAKLLGAEFKIEKVSPILRRLIKVAGLESFLPLS